MPSSDAADRARQDGLPAPVAYAVRLMWFNLLFCAVATAVLGADDVASLYGTPDEEFGGLEQSLFLVALAVAIAVAVVWALLAVAIRRGSRGARVVTWLVAAGSSALGLAFLLTPSAGGFVVVAVLVMAAISVLLAHPAGRGHFRRG